MILISGFWGSSCPYQYVRPIFPWPRYTWWWNYLHNYGTSKT